ncbi:unnamed protein product [Symbiodinium necroappetens]|uniref:GH16 domain-containing protein n=1 Tax=Symbiodinium necroappetens TaxID=1628268 RepID=A0A812VE34_9DINO|nr:unnamed protein product [Symbiodinium necroappetens]
MSPGPLVLMILAGSVNACDVSECQDDSQGLLQLMKAKHRDPWCSASPGCSKLGFAGACCPTAGGVYLHCCRGGTSHNDTTMQSTTAVHSKPTTSFRTQTTHLTTTEPTTSYMTQATHTTTTIRNRPSAAQLSCSGEGFLDCWTFFTKADPTHGYIQYVSQREAMQLGLYILRDGAVRLGSLVGQNRPVKAVRLQSKMRFYAGHLFVIDIKHMPTGGGTWPAWWAYGPGWPNKGEIDIIETVNTEQDAQSTLHTSPGCSMPSFSGLFNPNCNAGSATEGCGRHGPPGSGGSAFNQNGGGVFAAKWTSSGIKMWFFPRNQIPADLTREKPDSTRWGEPYVTFPFGPRCPPYHFENMVLVINLDFCGDWAGNVYPGGRNVCMAYVKNPANAKALSEAFWEINYVKAHHKMYTFAVPNDA